MRASAKPEPYISNRLWSGAIALFLVTLFVGALGSDLLARGAADPPRAPQLLRELANLDGLLQVVEGDTVRVQLGAGERPLSLSCCFTLEAQAVFRQPDSGAWGIWMDGGDDTQVRALVRPDGYFREPLMRRWQQFIHLTPSRNQIVLHSEPFRLTLRLNREVAAEMPLTRYQTSTRIGILLEAAHPADVLWEYIRVYASES